MRVNSYELISDYRQNVAAAKSKYDGKIISVNGEVTNIYETWIVIGYDITCEFSDNKGLKSIESIQKGSIVTIKGEVDGTTFGGSVQISNCIIENKNSNSSNYETTIDRTCEECGKIFVQSDGWACRLDPECYSPTKSAPIQSVKYCSPSCASNKGMKLRIKKCD